MGEKAERTSSLRDNNYYTVQGWMINKLGLKGSELQLYAIIHGFSQTEGQVFSGAAQYLADWTNISRRNVMERLRSVDQVAYVRFASVYRQFKDIDTFMTELNKLLAEK